MRVFCSPENDDNFQGDCMLLQATIHYIAFLHYVDMLYKVHAMKIMNFFIG